MACFRRFTLIQILNHLTDQPMKDRRDSWAAAENIIPSASGAARALQFIWKDLQITGKAYRVPTRTGSIAELKSCY